NPEEPMSSDVPNIRFTVSLRDIEGDHELVARDLKTSNLTLNDGWGEISVDLSAWAGHRVDLVLAVGASAGASAATAGWGSPRITRAPQEGASKQTASSARI